MPRVGIDASYPVPAEAWPSGTAVVCGYVGLDGATPHVWTPAEAAYVREHGAHWWPIWVPVQGRWTAAVGTEAAHGMLAALPRYGHHRHQPVILDIEHDTWAADPSGARAAAVAWEHAMAAGGYRRTVVYAPSGFGRGWLARWGVDPPTALPTGYVGWQWSGSAPGRPYDRSIWSDAMFPKSTEQTDPPARLVEIHKLAVAALANPHVGGRLELAYRRIRDTAAAELAVHRAGGR